MKKIILFTFLALPSLAFANTCPIVETPYDLKEYKSAIQRDIKTVTEDIKSKTLIDIDTSKTTKDEIESRLKYANQVMSNKWKEFTASAGGFSGSFKEWSFWIFAAKWDVPSFYIRDYEILNWISESIKYQINSLWSSWYDISHIYEENGKNMWLFTLLEKNEALKEHFKDMVLTENKAYTASGSKIPYSFNYYWQNIDLLKYKKSIKSCSEEWSISKAFEKVVDLSERFKGGIPTKPWREAISLWNDWPSPSEERDLLEEYLNQTWVSTDKSEIILWNLDSANWVSGLANSQDTSLINISWLKSNWEQLTNAISELRKTYEEKVWSLDNIEQKIDLSSYEETYSWHDRMWTIKGLVSAWYQENKMYLSWYNTNKEAIIAKLVETHIKLSKAIQKMDIIEERAIAVCESQAKWKWICRAIKQNTQQ